MWYFLPFHGYNCFAPALRYTRIVCRDSGMSCLKDNVSDAAKGERGVSLHTKVNVKLYLTTPWRHMTVATIILNLGTSQRWVVNFTSRLAYTPGKTSDTHWIWGWMSLRDCLDDLENRQNSCAYRNSNPVSSDLWCSHNRDYARPDPHSTTPTNSSESHNFATTMTGHVHKSKHKPGLLRVSETNL